MQDHIQMAQRLVQCNCHHIFVTQTSMVIRKEMYVCSSLPLGSPSIQGEEVEDTDVNDAANGSNYKLGLQDRNQNKKAQPIQSSDMSYGRGEDVGPPNYDKEVSLNHISLLTNGRSVS